jgi:serine protease Do
MKNRLIFMLVMLGLFAGSCAGPPAEVPAVGSAFIAAPSGPYAQIYRQTVFIETESGQGSGVIIAPDLILTAGHMVDGDSRAEIYLSTGRWVSAVVVKDDDSVDLALLRTDEPLEIPYIKISDTPAALGSSVMVCGTPYGVFLNTLSRGILSGLNRTWDEFPGVMFYQTDAYIAYGNSGGPWINEQGELIAITSWGWDSNLSFGVPAHSIREFLDVRGSTK